MILSDRSLKEHRFSVLLKLSKEHANGRITPTKLQYRFNILMST